MKGVYLPNELQMELGMLVGSSTIQPHQSKNDAAHQAMIRFPGPCGVSRWIEVSSYLRTSIPTGEKPWNGDRLKKTPPMLVQDRAINLQSSIEPCFIMSSGTKFKVSCLISTPASEDSGVLQLS